MSEIKPRIDDDGPKCFFIDKEEKEICPQIYGHMCCKLDNLSHWTKLCPHAVKRMAVEIEAWRNGRLQYEMTVSLLHEEVEIGDLCIDGVQYNTIDAAIDALMAERDNKVGYIQQGSYTCNGSPRGCEGERFGGCDHCDALIAEREE